MSITPLQEVRRQVLLNRYHRDLEFIRITASRAIEMFSLFSYVDHTHDNLIVETVIRADCLAFSLDTYKDFKEKVSISWADTVSREFVKISIDLTDLREVKLQEEKRFSGFVDTYVTARINEALVNIQGNPPEADFINKKCGTILAGIRMLGFVADAKASAFRGMDSLENIPLEVKEQFFSRLGNMIGDAALRLSEGTGWVVSYRVTLDKSASGGLVELNLTYNHGDESPSDVVKAHKEQ